MPRPRFSDWIITPTAITVAANSSYTLYLDLVDTFYPQLYVKCTWQATAGTTGISIGVAGGYAIDQAGDLEYVDYQTPITIHSQPSTNSLTAVTTRNDFSLDEETFPRRVKVVITNLDTTNAMTLFVSGDR